MFPKLKELLKSESVFLASLPFLATLAFICYQTGYLGYFNIPIELVSPTVTGIVQALAFLALAAVLPYMGISLILAMATTKRSAWARAVGLSLTYGIIPLPFALLDLTNKRFWFCFVGMVTVGLVLHLIIPVLNRRKHGSFGDAVNASLEAVRSDSPTSARSNIEALIFMLMMSTFFAMGAGRLKASEQYTFLVLASDETLLLIVATDSSLVMCRTDQAQHRQAKAIVILPRGANIELKKIKTGTINSETLRTAPTNSSPTVPSLTHDFNVKKGETNLPASVNRPVH